MKFPSIQTLWNCFLFLCRNISLMYFYICCYVFASDLEILPSNYRYKLMNEDIAEVWLVSAFVAAITTFALWWRLGNGLARTCFSFLLDCVFGIIMAHIAAHNVQIKYYYSHYWIKSVLFGLFTLPNRYTLKIFFLFFILHIIFYYVREVIKLIKWCFFR